MKIKTIITRGAFILFLARHLNLPAQTITIQQPEWHTEPISFFSLSPDGKQAMSGDDDRIILTEIGSGKTVRSIAPSQAPLRSAAFSPDGKQLLVGLNDGHVILWDIDKNTGIWDLDTGLGNLETVAFSPDAKYMLAASYEKISVYTYPEHILKFKCDLHNKEIYRTTVGFNRTGDILFGSTPKNIQAWDVATGTQTLDIKPPANHHIDAFNLDAAWFVVYPTNDYINEAVKKLKEGEIFRHKPLVCSIPNPQKQFSLDSLSQYNFQTFSKDGHYLFTTCLQSLGDFRYAETVDLWDLKTQQKVRQFKHTGNSGYVNVKAIMASDDNQRLAVISDNKWLDIYEILSGRLIHRIPCEHGGIGLQLNFSADSRLLLYAAPSGLTLFDVAGGRSLWSSAGESMFPGKVIWEKGGKSLWSKHDDILDCMRKWDVQKGNLSLTIKSTPDLINAFAFNKDQTLLLISAGKSAKLWRATDGALLQIFSDDNPALDDVLDVAFSPDDQKVALVFAFRKEDGSSGLHYKMKIFDLVSGKPIFVYPANWGKYSWQISFSPDGKKLALNAGNGTVVILDVNSGKTLQELQFDERTEGSVFSPDGRYLAAWAIDDHLVFWDAEKGKLLKKVPAYGINFHCFSKDSRYLFWIDTSLHLKAWDVQKNSLIYSIDDFDAAAGALYDPSKGYIYLSDNYILQQRNMTNGKIIGQFKTNGYVEAIDTLSNKAVAVNGALMTIYDLTKREELYSLLPVDSANYMFSLPSGEYFGTKGAVKKTSFYLGSSHYDFEQFDVQKNRPDKVLKALSCPDATLISAYRSAWLKRISKMGVADTTTFALTHPPTITLKRENLPLLSDTADVMITIQAKDSLTRLDRILVFVNDIPVFGRSGISIRQANAQKIEKKIRIPLAYNPDIGGTNKIQISVSNIAGVESLKETVYVTRSRPVHKPFKYVIAIGTDTFLHAPDKTLDYAVKDANDLSQVLSRPDDRFAGVKTYLMVGRNFTRDKVNSLKSMLSKTKTDDHVYIFVSSHGVLDNALDYYLATYDMLFDQPTSKGLSYDDLEQLLDSIPAMNKLLLVDACHAGEIDKETIERIKSENTQKMQNIKFKSFPTSTQSAFLSLENSFNLMREVFVDLRRGTGATVISAAAGVEFAQEGQHWNNSVFTYCLLSGLRDKKADLNQDNKIMVSELQDYLARSVIELTNGLQRPEFRTENIANDWRMW